MSTLFRLEIDPSYDRKWLASKAPIVSYADDLDEDGRWAFSTGDLDGALFLIENYPVAYLEKRLPEAKQAIEDRANKEFQRGFTHTSGPLAGHTLQCRDMEDRTNWLASQVAYSAAIAAGAGALPDAVFRTAANETITCTYQEGSEALLAMQSWGSAIMRRAWELKDAAAAAANIGELDLVLAGLDDGWPSTNAV